MLRLQSNFWPATTSGQGLCLSSLCYLLGCFTAGYYLVRIVTHKDIRQIGSGSVGARNVGRLLGWTAFVFVVLFDIAKGALAVAVVRHFSPDNALAALAMIAVVAGHIWPMQLRFHGGKGVATSLGALLIYDPHLILAFGALYIFAILFLRNSTLSGLIAFALLPFAGMMMKREGMSVISLSILAAMVLVAHRKKSGGGDCPFSPWW